MCSMKLCIIVLSSVVTIALAVSPEKVFVEWNPLTQKYAIYNQEINNPVAIANYRQLVNETGWAFLTVETFSSFPDSVQAYAAGLAEGYLTKDLLKMHWKNKIAKYCLNEEKYCEKLKLFLTINLIYMTERIKQERTHNEYWHQAGLVLEQLSGIEDGYRNKSGNPRTAMDVMDLMLINLQGDLIDLEKILGRKVLTRVLGSCSALIKVLPGNKDILIAHDTWASYNTMLRVLKKYNFTYHRYMSEEAPIVPGQVVSFSSQPGLVGSIDDFNLLSSGLVTTETTIENNNPKLWKYVKPDQIVMEYIRSAIANRLALDGNQWTKIFSNGNSGTYNNQWMVLDFKRFRPGEPLDVGLFYVIEQLPGYTTSGDMTSVLSEQGYWPSYNRPYFKDVFEKSGSEELVKKFGDWFSYEKTPRALIFKREHAKVRDIKSMIKLMRYNDFQKDPLSRCNCTPPYSAVNAIAARCDLNPPNGTYPFPSLGHFGEGAIDMKMTTSDLFKNLEFIAIAGPTYDPLPPFQWSKSDFEKTSPHEGHPDLWKFEPVIFRG